MSARNIEAVATRLLIVDDDTELCELVTQYLRTEGFELEAVHTGEQGIELAPSGQYALIVLDVMLPDVNGFDALRRIRSQSGVPVLMLTARGEEVDRVVGLEIGADDYLAKPFSPRELVARIRAILRRTRREVGPTSCEDESTLVAGDITLNPASRTVRCGERPIELTGVEFTLLETLLRSAGKLIERDQLSREVLGRRLQPYDRSIDVHVSNLRKKLVQAGAADERIRSVRGRGYILTIPTEHSSRQNPWAEDA